MLVVAAAAFPSALQPLNKLWLKLGLLLGKIVTPIVMFAVYAIAVVPIGLILRALGKRPLGLEKQDGSSYWVTRQPPGPQPETLENQF